MGWVDTLGFNPEAIDFEAEIGRNEFSVPAVVPEPAIPTYLDPASGAGASSWNPIPDILRWTEKVGEVSIGANRPATSATLRPASPAAVASAAATVTRRPFPRALVVVGLGVLALVILGGRLR